MLYRYRAFSHDVTNAILVSQNNENETNLRSAGLLSEKALFQTTCKKPCNKRASLVWEGGSGWVKEVYIALYAKIYTIWMN